MSIAELSNRALLWEYSDMIRWNHYDPMGAKQPSKFELEELEAELLRRLENRSETSSDDDAVD